MVLTNFACQEAGRCLASCGMCADPDNRKMSSKSLFGICRELGYCVEDCGLCAALAGNANPGHRRGAAQPRSRKKQQIIRHSEGCFDPLTQELLCTSQQRYCIIE